MMHHSILVLRRRPPPRRCRRLPEPSSLRGSPAAAPVVRTPLEDCATPALTLPTPIGARGSLCHTQSTLARARHADPALRFRNPRARPPVGRPGPANEEQRGPAKLWVVLAHATARSRRCRRHDPLGQGRSPSHSVLAMLNRRCARSRDWITATRATGLRVIRENPP